MIYVDESGNVLINPDMTKGKIVEGSEKQVVIAHHDAVAEVSHWEPQKGAGGAEIIDDNGYVLQRHIIDTPATPAYDDYDTQATYHAYTADEQAIYDAGKNSGQYIVEIQNAMVELAGLIGGNS